MKKSIVFFVLFFVLSIFIFSQNNLTSEQIRQYAYELGVPYEALLQLINSYKIQTRLNNPNAEKARIVSIQELLFMRDSNMLNPDSYYIINAIFGGQSGRNVMLYSNNSTHGINTDANFLITFPKSEVTVLIKYKLTKEFIIEEIIMTKELPPDK